MAPETKPKTYTLEEIRAVKFVQNISGAIAYLSDLSEDGKEGKGVTMNPDAVLELRAVVTDEAKVRSKALKRGLEGFAGDRSFSPMSPTLRAVTGPDDPTLVKTATMGATIDKRSPVTRTENIFDVAMMEQNLKELEDELESTQDAAKRAVLQTTIDMTRKTVEEKRANTLIGTAASVQVLSGGPPEVEEEKPIL